MLETLISELISLTIGIVLPYAPPLSNHILHKIKENFMNSINATLKKKDMLKGCNYPDQRIIWVSKLQSHVFISL